VYTDAAIVLVLLTLAAFAGIVWLLYRAYKQ